jgi:hypothetical protein
MVNIGSLDTKVMGSLATLTIGTSVYALAENFSYDQGYKEIVEAVPGTTTQVIGPGGFLGEFESDVIFSTDFPKNLFDLTAGDLAKQSIVVTVGTAVWTAANCRIFRVGAPLVRKDGMVRARIRGIYPAPAS